MGFAESTRRFVYPLNTQSKAAGDTGGKIVRYRLDKAGILGGIGLDISGSIAGTLSAPNALGKASIVKEVRVTANGKIDIDRFSGAQYHYLVRDQLEHYVDVVSYADARSAVATGAFDLSMWIPIALNARDVPGLLMLQNEQMEVILSVEFEADAQVATGITSLTADVVPYLEMFTVPVSDKDLPPLNIVHAINAESKVISATSGDQEYEWPRGNTYLSVFHGYGIGASPADSWTRVKLKATGNQVIDEFTPTGIDIEFTRFRGRARPLGVVGFDLLGSSGLGSYGSSRDVLYSQAITELKTVLTVSAAATLHSVRRELITLEA